MTLLKSEDWSLIAQGAWTSLWLFSTAFALSVVLGSIIGLVRSGPATRWTIVPRILLFWFSAIVRGVPQLTLLLFAYFGPAFLGYGSSSILAAIIVLVAFGAASISEVAIGAIDSIAPGQWDASRSLGMSRRQLMRRVIGPQAVTVALPSTVGLAAQLLKLTSITTVIGVTELLRAGNIIAVRDREPMTVYVTVGVVYLILVTPLTLLGRRLERRMEFEVAN